MAKKEPFVSNAGQCNCDLSYKDESKVRCPYCKVEFTIKNKWSNEKYMHVDSVHWHVGCFALYTHERLEAIMRYATQVRAESVALEAKLRGDAE